MRLNVIGFCGADDSVHPNQLILYAKAYPFIEFGVLFRPDKEGQPRYASKGWVSLLSQKVKAIKDHQAHNIDGGIFRLNLAAHLCERRVDEVLRGDDTFIQNLHSWGFERVQINATAVNGVDTSVFTKNQKAVVDNLLQVVRKHPELEFIIQKNAETRPLWQGILDESNKHQEVAKNGALEVLEGSERVPFPSNMSMLLDESKGTGVLPEVWSPISPDQSPNYKVGYAGGIGPENVANVLLKIQEAAKKGVGEVEDDHNSNKSGKVDDKVDENVFWIDMESSLRSQKNGTDVFDLDKCYQVILEVCREGYFAHPPWLPETML